MEGEKRKSMQVLAIKKESEKVASTVATFLNEDSHGFQVPTSRLDWEKVTIMVGTFLNEGSNGLLTIRIAMRKNVTRKGCHYGDHLFDRR